MVNFFYNLLEVGGPKHFVQTQPGNRFVSFVRARGVHCLVRMSLKRKARAFPFSLFAVGGFPFSLFEMSFPFSLEIASEIKVKSKWSQSEVKVRATVKSKLIHRKTKVNSKWTQSEIKVNSKQIPVNLMQNRSESKWSETPAPHPTPPNPPIQL